MNPSDCREELTKLLAQREAIDQKIGALLDRFPARNKTTVRYQILGLCPHCGGAREKPGSYYCRKCKKKDVA